LILHPEMKEKMDTDMEGTAWPTFTCENISGIGEYVYYGTEKNDQVEAYLKIQSYKTEMDIHYENREKVLTDLHEISREYRIDLPLYRERHQLFFEDLSELAGYDLITTNDGELVEEALLPNNIKIVRNVRIGDEGSSTVHIECFLPVAEESADVEPKIADFIVDINVNPDVMIVTSIMPGEICLDDRLYKEPYKSIPLTAPLSSKFVEAVEANGCPFPEITATVESITKDNVKQMDLGTPAHRFNGRDKDQQKTSVSWQGDKFTYNDFI
jgi:hypothetical protein